MGSTYYWDLTCFIHTFLFKDNIIYYKRGTVFDKYFHHFFFYFQYSGKVLMSTLL